MSFEGELSDLNLIAKLVELGKEHFTGAIRFENDGIIKIIYFKNGDVLSASTNDRTDSIDEILLRAGKVSREHVKQALAKRKESETLGDALLNLGYITRKELTWARRVQVLGIIRSIEGWTAGSYTIVDEYLPKREEGTLFPLSQILLELVVTDPDRSKYEQALDSGNVVYTKKLGFEAMFKLLGLNQDAEDIARQIDGARNAADVAAASGKDTFNVFKLLYALEMLGMLERAELMPAAPYADDRSAVTEAFPMVGVEAHESEPGPAMPAWDAEPWDSQQSENMPRWDAAPAAAATTTAWDERSYDASTDLDLPAHFDEPPGEFTPSPTINSLDPVEVRSAVNENLGLHDGEAGTSRRRVGKGLMWALVTVLVLAAAGFGAYRWWDSRQAPEPLFVARPKHRPIAPAPLPASVTPVTASGTTATSATGDTTGLVTSTTTATATTATLPPVVASSTHAPVVPPSVPTTTTSAPAPKIAAVTPPKVTPAPPTPTSTPTTLIHKNGTPTITNLNGKPHVESGHPARPEPVRPTKIAKVAPAPAPIATVPASTDAMRARYDSMARDFSAGADAAKPFTVQFELVCQTDSVRKAVSGGGSSVWFVPTTFQGKPCYRVFWGHYASRQEALQSLNAIPETLRAGSTPTVVRYAH